MSTQIEKTAPLKGCMFATPQNTPESYGLMELGVERLPLDGKHDANQNPKP